MFKKDLIKLIILGVLVVGVLAELSSVFISKSNQDEGQSKTSPVLGSLKGEISIGPFCPVEPCPVSVPNPY